jgi:uncharacterized YccA/Bax inhibitor family protein
MQSTNPVFARTDEFKQGGYATFDDQPRRGGGRSTEATSRTGYPTPAPGQLEEMYRRPSATPAQSGRMTLDDVVMKTAAIFGVLTLVAAATFFLLAPSLVTVFGGMIVGFGLAMWITFSKKVRPGAIMAYAVAEGVFVGAISDVYATAFGGNIVPQAILGTLAAFSAMLFAYKTGLIRNSPKFQKILSIAVIGYLVFGVVHLLGVVFGAWESIYFGGDGPNILGIGLSLFGVVLASLFLVLDFDYIEKGIANGIPEQYAWMAAFGLVVTLVWLYLEILRLLAILRGND